MSTELSLYIEKRIVSLLYAAMELKEELPLSNVNFVLSNQIARKIKMTEEVYGKAKKAGAGKEFVMKMNEAKREVRETRYWVRVLKKTSKSKRIDNLEDESEELIKIFSRLTSLQS